MRLTRKLSIALVVSALSTGAAYADQVAFKATLEPSSEVPPTTSHGSGSVRATLDTATKAFKWKISYKGLSGPAIAAHFHGPAPVGQNAAPVIAVKVPKAAEGSASGEQTLTSAQINDLETGKWYFNIHTAQHKSGEIRGQVMPGH